MGTETSNTAVTYTYEYDHRGFITSVTGTDGSFVSYEYDEIGQLIRENNEKLNKTYVYTYDKAGNILTKKTYAYTSAASLTGVTPLESKTYGYSNDAWGDKLTSYDGTAITYDAIGNPLSYYNGSSYSFTWQGRRLKTAVKGNLNLSFSYNDEGIRTSKVVNGVEHTYILEGTRIISEEWDGNFIVYIYDEAGTPIGMHYLDTSNEDYPWETYWFEKNSQGDIVAVYDDYGIVNLKYTYDAWGNHEVEYWNGGGNSGAQYNPFRYRGYYFDEDLGMYYLQSRYYDPAIGRFVSEDGYVSTGQGVIGYNMYVYCNNNPIMFLDLLGLYPEWIPDWLIYLYEKITAVEAQKAQTNISVQQKIISAFTDNSSLYVGAGVGYTTDLGVADYTVKAEQGLEITTDGIKKGEFGTNIASIKLGPISFTYGNKEFTPEDNQGEYTKSNNEWDITISLGKGFGVVFCWEVSFSISLRGVWNSFMEE